MIITVSKKWLIIGVVGASIVGVIGGLYLAGYMVRKTTEQIIRQIQTTPPLPPTTLSTPPTQSVTAPPPTTQQLAQTQNQQQVQLQVGGFLPPGYAPPPPPKPPTTCTGTCPPGTIPMLSGIAHMAGCPVVTTVCGVVCVPNNTPCIAKANQLEAQLSIYTSPQYL